MIGKKKISVQILVIIVLIIGTLWAGFPIVWMFLNSFKPNAEIFAWPPTWISENFSLNAYKAIFTKSLPFVCFSKLSTTIDSY